jgi:AhpD family alkylhydroperoxidase
MLGLKTKNTLSDSSADTVLLHLVKMRASQINGCAYCLAMHARELRESGEREDRIYVLDAWRETSWFTDRERAALAWTEAVTILPNNEVPDTVFERARAQFSEQELADLTLIAIAINGWNRINIAFRNQPVPFMIESNQAVAAH